MRGQENKWACSAASSSSRARCISQAALEHHARPRSRPFAGTLVASRRVLRAVTCECADRRTEGRALRQIPQAAARKLHWSTTTPDTDPALTQARSQHHAEPCGQSLVRARAGEPRGVLCGLKSRQLPLESCSSVVQPTTPVRTHTRLHAIIGVMLRACPRKRGTGVWRGGVSEQPASGSFHDLTQRPQSTPFRAPLRALTSDYPQVST